MTEPMFVRAGGFEIRPGTFDAVRERYTAECAPVVLATDGNVDCFVLESADSPTSVVICTVWRTEADAVAYEASGRAAEMVGRLSEFFAGSPTLRSYRVHRPTADD